MQTDAKKNIDVSQMEIKLVDVALQKKIPIEKFKGQVSKVVYLTFDDGPNESTNQILDILKKERVSSTFFIVGSMVNEKNENILKRIVEEGHYLGSHSMTHNYQLLYKNKTYVHEMLKVQKIIQDVAGVESTLVRSPYGSYPGLIKEMRDDAVKNQLKIWDWTIDSLDWSLMGEPEKILANIKEQTKKDIEVILLHDRKTTAEVLPKIIQFLRSQGYVFKSYNEQDHFPLNFWNDERL